MHLTVKKAYYIKERGRLLHEIAAYTNASLSKNRFNEYYKERIAYLEKTLTKLESGDG